jgi:hypothetical protein
MFKTKRAYAAAEHPTQAFFCRCRTSYPSLFLPPTNILPKPFSAAAEHRLKYTVSPLPIPLFCLRPSFLPMPPFHSCSHCMQPSQPCCKASPAAKPALQPSQPCSQASHAAKPYMQPSQPCSQAIHAAKPYMQPSHTCSQAIHAAKPAMQQSHTCSQASHAAKPAMQPSQPCSKASHAAKHDMQPSLTCSQAAYTPLPTFRRLWGYGSHASGLCAHAHAPRSRSVSPQATAHGIRLACFGALRTRARPSLAFRIPCAVAASRRFCPPAFAGMQSRRSQLHGQLPKSHKHILGVIRVADMGVLNVISSPLGVISIPYSRLYSTGFVQCL